MVKVKRPLVRYHGGKWKLAKWIISHFPSHRVYCEPYGGGGSVLIQKPRSYAEIYNDLDGEIVNLFKVARDRYQELERLVSLTPFSRDEFFLSYEPSCDEVEQARRTLVRSFMGFGSATTSGAKSGFRANSNRSGTTPAHDWANFPKNLQAVSERLAGVVVENRLAIDVMKHQDGKSTLHYVDPPYVLSTRSMKNPYCKKGYRFEMTDEQHEELAECLNTLKGSVVLSGYDCELYRKLYADWDVVSRDTFADGARDRTELLWIKRNNTQGVLF